MRNYAKSARWTIDKERYRELSGFCKQYPKWKVELAETTDLSSPKLDGMPRGTDVSDPTERAVERRERLLMKIDLVDKCANAPDNGAWYKALILSICNGKGYEAIRDDYPEILPTSHRKAFFDARRVFFLTLDKLWF